MKYLYYIIGIILCLSFITGLQLFKKKDTADLIAIKVNDKIITKNDFEKMYSPTAQYYENKNNFIDYLITKNILIQEAEKQGIDQEESFRLSMKNFYEQSLTKILIDRKYINLNIAINNAEIDQYIKNGNKIFHLMEFSFIENELIDLKDKEGRKTTISFLDMSHKMQYAIISAQDQNITKPILSEEGYLIYRIENIEEDSSISQMPLSRSDVEKILKEVKRDNSIDEWIRELKKKASVQIFIE